MDNLPDWCGCTEFGGQVPVQGLGACAGHVWYFRARYDNWSIKVSKTGELDNDCPGDYFRSYDYPGGPYAAGYMPLAEARDFIVRELTSWLRGREFRITLWLGAP